MAPRLLIFSVLDPRGRYGMPEALRGLRNLDVEPIPVPTGYVDRKDGRVSRIYPMPARMIGNLARAAMDNEPEAVLLGIMPRARTVRAVAKALQECPTLLNVLAPMSMGLDTPKLLGRRSLEAVFDQLVPEATAVVLPIDQAEGLVRDSGGGLEGARSAGRALVAQGCRVSWLIGEREGGRGLDIVVDHDGPGILDYPEPVAETESEGGAAILAGFLATGMPLKEALGHAHRRSRGFDRLQHTVVTRG